MAVSLEARVPLLDTNVIELALSLPGKFRVDAKSSKVLFRQAITGLVPDFVLRRPKQGFGIPLAKWFRGPLRDRAERLRTSGSSLGEYVDGAALNRVISEHLSGRRDHSGLMWRVMVLGFWLEALATGAMAHPPVVGGVNFDEIRRGS